jgi:hypothetical protein
VGGSGWGAHLMRSFRRLLSGEERRRASALSLMAPEEALVFRAWISSMDRCEVSEDHLHSHPHTPSGWHAYTLHQLQNVNTTGCSWGRARIVWITYSMHVRPKKGPKTLHLIIWGLLLSMYDISMQCQD